MRDYSQFGSSPKKSGDNDAGQQQQQQQQYASQQEHEAYYNYEEPYQEIGMSTQCFAEFLGTYTTLLIGLGSECVSLYLADGGGRDGGGDGLGFSVAMYWAVGATLGIYVSGPISGGHLNPAVSLAFALVRRTAFPFYKLLPFWIAQLFGGILAGITTLLLFHKAILNYEDKIGCGDGSSGGRGFLGAITNKDSASACCLDSSKGLVHYWR